MGSVAGEHQSQAPSSVWRQEHKGVIQERKTSGKTRGLEELGQHCGILKIPFFLVQAVEGKDGLAFVTEMTGNHPARLGWENQTQ